MLLDEVLSTVESRTKKSEDYLSVQNDVALDLKILSKRLYDFTKEETKRKNDGLPELVIQDFDEEQIWQQLELQNEGELVHFLTEVSRVLAGNKKLDLPISLSRKEDEIVNDAASDNDAEDKLENPEFVDSDDEMDLNMDVNGKINRKKMEFKRKIKNPSVVDDKFFKLEELDEYLTKEDKKETQDDGNKEDESGDDEESVDLFDPVSDNDDDASEDDKMMKYADFFDSPESGDESERPTKRLKGPFGDNEKSMIDDHELANAELPRENKHQDKRVKFNLTNDSDETNSLDNRGEAPTAENNESTLGKRGERLQKRVKDLENETISEKPWQMKGEAVGPHRPQDSILEEFLECNITSRPPPVITHQTMIQLEDIIKQRIKDKAWDDVEKKFKPVETPMEYKKKLVMDQEKSKKSLAQIYEDAYVKQREALDPENEERQEEDPKEHREIREMMHSLFRKLDALSNFHYTPKHAQPEVKIVSNLPAVTMEEVAPVSTTDAALLAPEEIKSKPRGELVGRAERTTTDMKRERRKKKMKQRVHQKAAETKKKTLAEKLKSVGKKYTKGEAASVIKKLTKDRNIVKMNETSNKITKSSTAFFAQLQDQVKSSIKTKTGKPVKKKDKNALSAVKLKL